MDESAAGNMLDRMLTNDREHRNEAQPWKKYLSPEIAQMLERIKVMG
jgi:hypothetical protein